MTFRGGLRGFKVIYLPPVLKFFKKISRREEARIRNKFGLICSGEESNQVIKMRDRSGLHYRLRIGDFRAIFRIERNKVTVVVIKVDYRKDVYNDY